MNNPFFLKRSIMILSVIFLLQSVFLVSDQTIDTFGPQKDLHITFTVPSMTDNANIHRVKIIIQITPGSKFTQENISDGYYQIWIDDPDIDPDWHKHALPSQDTVDVGNWAIAIEDHSSIPDVMREYHVILTGDNSGIAQLNQTTEEQVWQVKLVKVDDPGGTPPLEVKYVNGVQFTISFLNQRWIIGENFATPDPPHAAITTLPENAKPEINTLSVQSVSTPTGDFPVNVTLRAEALGYGDTDGEIVSFKWDFGDGETATPNATINGNTYSQVPNDYTAAEGEGSYIVTVKAIDDDDAESDSKQTTVSLYKPTAGYTVVKDKVLVNEDIHFTNTSIDSDGSIVSQSWNDGTNDFSTNTNPVHSFDLRGEYNIDITATDETGFTDQYSDTINVLRKGYNIVLVLDHSGSMLSNDKWINALAGARQFIELLFDLRNDDDDYTAFPLDDFEKDNCAVISYTTSTGDASWPYGLVLNTDTTTGSEEASLLRTDWIVTHEPALGLQGYNLTPTGEALNKAINILMNSESDNPVIDKKEHIIILTDGQNNAGDYEIDAIASNISTINSDTGNSKNISVYTVVVGGDHHSWPEEIAHLATATTGGEYRLAVDTRILDQFFAQILGEALGQKTNFEEVSGGEADINDEDAIAIISHWKREVPNRYYFTATNNEVGIILTPDNVDDYGNVTISRRLDDDNYMYYLISDPSSSIGTNVIPVNGHWTFNLMHEVNGDINDEEHEAAYYVIYDVDVYADFSIDQRKHATGEMIVLAAQLTDHEQPLTGAEVYVQVRRPEEGAGEIMASYSLLRKVTPVAASRPTHTTSVVSLKDKKSAQFQHVITALKQQGKTDIDYADEKIILKDDGIGEDKVANDGIYTAILTNLEYEGNYTFDFLSKGETLTGEKFQRTETIAQFVRLGIDQDKTDFSYKIIKDRVNGKRVVLVYVNPRDKYGRRLGPYHDKKIRFYFEGGQPDDNNYYEHDHDVKNGGCYYQKVLFDDRKELPVVMVQIRDTLLKKKLALRTFHLIELYAKVGYGYFDPNLSIEQGIAFGGGLIINPSKLFGFEFDFTAVPTKDNYNNEGMVFCGGLSGIYYLPEQLNYTVTPYVVAGANLLYFNNFYEEGLSIGLNIGGGAKYSFDIVGIRLDFRYCPCFCALSQSMSHNIQATAGIFLGF